MGSEVAVEMDIWYRYQQPGSGHDDSRISAEVGSSITISHLST